MMKHRERINAARHGVTNWTLRKDTPTDAKHATLVMPAWNVNGRYNFGQFTVGAYWACVVVMIVKVSRKARKLQRVLVPQQRGDGIRPTLAAANG